MNRQQKDDQEALDSLLRKKTDLDNRNRQLTHEMTESTKRVEKLREHIRVYEASLDEQRRIRDELKLEVGSSKGVFGSLLSIFILTKICNCVKGKCSNCSISLTN